MLLHRIHLNPRCKEARRDLADPYQMHATLCRAFFPEDMKCPPGALLWRLEPESEPNGAPRALIQCRMTPDWSRIAVPDWLACADRGIDLVQRLALDSLDTGRVFRFRLRANPCKTVNGKRVGLVGADAQRDWLARKGERHGFSLSEPLSADYFEFQQISGERAYPDVRVTQEQMLGGRRKDGKVIRVFSALFEGRLRVTDVEPFRKTLETGIGHGKVMGLGLLSVLPMTG